MHFDWNSILQNRMTPQLRKLHITFNLYSLCMRPVLPVIRNKFITFFAVVKGYQVVVVHQIRWTWTLSCTYCENNIMKSKRSCCYLINWYRLVLYAFGADTLIHIALAWLSAVVISWTYWHRYLTSQLNLG